MTTQYLAVIAVVWIALGIGYWMGVRHERQRVLQAAEHVRSIMATESDGHPVNINQPPSIVRPAKWRQTEWGHKDSRWSRKGMQP